jgi:hypothetical protein
MYDCFDSSLNDPNKGKTGTTAVLKVALTKYIWLRKSKRRGKVIYLDIVGRQDMMRRPEANHKKPT